MMLIIFRKRDRSLPLLRTDGRDLKNWHVVGFDAEKDARWAFADNVCLSELVNGTCRTPAGIAAISYDINPLVSEC